MADKKGNEMNYLFFLLLLIPLPAYATVTVQNTDFEFDDWNLNVTAPITIDSLALTGEGAYTRFTSADELREYQFDNTTSNNSFDVHWDSISSTKTQFNITEPGINVRGNVTGFELDLVELDDVSVSWFYGLLNIVDVDNAEKVEYFFTAPITSGFNAISIIVNKNPFEFGIYSDLTRMACNSSTQGGVIFNTDDLNLNICNGINWILPDGTIT